MASKYRNSGQTCVCVNRFLVQDSIYDAFIEKFTAAVKGLKVESGPDEGITQGPLINIAGMQKSADHMADALSIGGRVVTGGNPHALGRSFYESTVIADVTWHYPAPQGFQSYR